MQEPVEEEQEFDDEDLKARMTDLCKIEDWPLRDFRDGATGRQVTSPMHACSFLMFINIKEARPLLGSTSSFAKVLLMRGGATKTRWFVTCRVYACGGPW